MKKFLRIVFVLTFVFILSGCTKNIDKISYTTYNEYFTKRAFDMMDNTNQQDMEIRKYIIATNNKIAFTYIEFDTEKSAKEYLSGMYLVDKDNKAKEKKTYTYVKNTKNQYMKLYQVGNVILEGKAEDKKFKRDVNKVLKELGY